MKKLRVRKPDQSHSTFFGVLSLLLLLALNAPAQARQRGEDSKPKPDLANLHYGPHERNVLDLWKANSDRPTPLVVHIHGGGFRGGDKSLLPADLLKRCLDSGISVMTINYRLSPEVHFPAHYMDCARAIQFARHHAKEWNIDPKRVAATGGSAGAGTSLWLGFHDDLADARSEDPVLRESTRLSCMAVLGAQSTYDPRVIKEWIGEAAAKHRWFTSCCDAERLPATGAVHGRQPRPSGAGQPRKSRRRSSRRPEGCSL